MKPFPLVVIVALAAIHSGCGQRGGDLKPEAAHTDGIAPVQLTSTNFQQEVIQSDLPVLVDMWATWCQPCIAMKPTLRQLAEELQGQVKVAELNIEENLFVTEKYEVDRYPMLLIFIDGEEVTRLIGSQPSDSLREALNEAITTSDQPHKD